MFPRSKGDPLGVKTSESLFTVSLLSNEEKVSLIDVSKPNGRSELIISQPALFKMTHKNVS